MEMLFKFINERNHKNESTKNERTHLEQKIQELQATNIYVPTKLRRLYQSPYTEITNTSSLVTHIRRFLRVFRIYNKKIMKLTRIDYIILHTF